jgi:hypothetical protein
VAQTVCTLCKRFTAQWILACCYVVVSIVTASDVYVIPILSVLS